MMRILALLACVGEGVSAAAAKPVWAGVNFGGWLVVENWIFPEFMDFNSITDEWHLVKSMGGNTNSSAVSFMQNHWDTFITEADLDTISEFGITHVRIPVGWWIIDWKQEVISCLWCLRI